MKDIIYNSTPVNKLTGIVCGEQPNDEINGNYTKQLYMSLIRPPIMNFNARGKCPNLTGLKFGKMVVVGLFFKQNPKKKLKWVVQCKCGYYTIRTSQTIRRKIRNGDFDECHRCQHVSNLSRI